GRAPCRWLRRYVRSPAHLRWHGPLRRRCHAAVQRLDHRAALLRIRPLLRIIMIRTIWVAINVLASTIPFSLLVVIGSYLGASSRFYDQIPRYWARWILWATGVRVEVQGVENLSPDSAQIIVSNHVSWYDVLALAAWT